MLTLVHARSPTHDPTLSFPPRRVNNWSTKEKPRVSRCRCCLYTVSEALPHYFINESISATSRCVETCASEGNKQINSLQSSLLEVFSENQSRKVEKSIKTRAALAEASIKNIYTPFRLLARRTRHPRTTNAISVAQVVQDAVMARS